jgi:hypothetical protein
MRLTTVIWLGVFMRLESQRGAYVTVVKKGAQQAGVAFVLHNHLNGTFDVYGPAPQSMIEENGAERKFEQVLDHVSSEEVDAFLERQKKFDPDIWVIETESGTGDISLSVVSPL